ncbi:MAG: hypothetical protein HY537_01985 [Deltaproteobacteria bacterium]|nr:hypothetical protein [Deltaproteobacteria bacterium]
MTEIIEISDDKLFAKYINLIIDKKHLILNSPELFYVVTRCASLSLAYIGGSGMIPLGILISLWDKGEFMAECPKCKGVALVFNLGGSVLSGTNKWNGVCPTCMEWVGGGFDKETDGKNLFERIKPVLEEEQRLGYTPPPDDPITSTGGMRVKGTSFPIRLELEPGHGKTFAPIGKIDTRSIIPLTLAQAIKRLLESETGNEGASDENSTDKN